MSGPGAALRAERLALVDQLVEENGGEALGLELLQHRGPEWSSKWCAIVPDSYESGAFKREYFDARGFSGHEGGYATAREALEAAVGDGYCLADPGALGRLSQTAEWAEGMAAVERVTRENGLRWEWSQGRISRKELEQGLAQGQK